MTGVILMMVATAVFLPFATLGVDPHHDGIMLKPALDVLSGQVLFKESFSQYGPLTTYLQALALGLSPTLLSLRLLTVAAYAGSLFFLYLAWREFLPRFLCVVAAFGYVLYAPFYDPYWPMLPWSSALALLFQSVALWALLRIVRGDSPALWSWGLGTACACTFWCRQPVGLVLGATVAGVAVVLHSTGWRPAGADIRKVSLRVLMGFASVSLPILAHIVFQGALADWWYQNILWPRQWAGRVDQTMFGAFSQKHLQAGEGLKLAGVLILVFLPALARRLRFGAGLPAWCDRAWAGGLVFVYLLFEYPSVRSCLLLPTGFGGGGWTVLITAGVVALAVARVWPLKKSDKARSHDKDAALATAGVSLGALLQLYPVPCMNHIYWSVAPALGLFVYGVWRLTRAKAALYGTLLAGLLLPAAREKYVLAQYTFGMMSVELQAPAVLKGMRVEPEQAAAYGRINGLLDRVLANHPDKTGLLYGGDALYLAFFSNLKNPSAYYVEWPMLGSRDERKARLDYLLGEKPVLILNQREPEMVSRFMAVIPDVGYRVVLHEPELRVWIALPVEEAEGLK
jgi:hypothetical protein